MKNILIVACLAFASLASVSIVEAYSPKPDSPALVTHVPNLNDFASLDHLTSPADPAEYFALPISIPDVAPKETEHFQVLEPVTGVCYIVRYDTAFMCQRKPVTPERAGVRFRLTPPTANTSPS